MRASPKQNIFLVMIRRDLTLAARTSSQWLNPLLFFVIAVSLFPIGVGPDPNMLRDIAPGVIWVAALLAMMLSQDTLFRTDYEDGSLEQILTSPHPLILMVAAKVSAHWMLTGLPLIVLSPVLAVLMSLSVDAWWTLVLSLLLGTPILSLLGALGAALVVSVKRGGVLLSLLVLPLCIPVLIFAATAVQTAGIGMSVEGHLSFLGALLALSVSLTPFAIAGALSVTGGDT
jgi:heme exporter protein B